MRPSRDHLRSAVGECLVRHPGERGALDDVLTAEMAGWPR